MRLNQTYYQLLPDQFTIVRMLYNDSDKLTPSFARTCNNVDA